jgi:IS1 family transposase
MDLCKKKKALCQEDFEKEYGRQWIWASLDPESKLIINFFIGQRTLEDCKIFINDLVKRIESKPLFTSDELPHYKTTLEETFSQVEPQPKTGKRGRPKKPLLVIDPELKYATVHKTRVNGKLVKVERNIIFGDPKQVEEIISASKTSNDINTSFIERVNLTLRNHSRKLTRKTLCFAKQKQALDAQTNIIITYYNFSKPHNSLTLKKEETGIAKKIERTPAMAAKLIDRIWPMGEILAYPQLINNN